MKILRFRQQGLGMIAAIAILVILAALAGAIASFGVAQQMTAAQDTLSVRAWQAAKAGNEWGLYQVFKSAGSWYPGATNDPCPSGLGAGTEKSLPLDVTAETGFSVTVRGQCWKYNEGESSSGGDNVIRIYRITAIACNAASCPAADASSPGYVERTRVVMATN